MAMEAAVRRQTQMAGDDDDLLNRLFDSWWSAEEERFSYDDVTPFTSPPSHFGGGSWEGLSHQQKEHTFYPSLERPAVLPALRVSSLNGNSKAEKLFDVISNGTFLARWREEREQEEVAFVMSAGYAPLRHELVPLVDPEYHGSLLVAGGRGRGNGGQTIEYDGEVHAVNVIVNSDAMSKLQPKFYASFSPENRVALFHRVVHQFLRHHGHLLSTDAVSAGVQALLSTYRKKRRKEALDIAMIHLDILITKRVTETLRSALNTVGECLEALERYEEAAQVYMDHEKFVPEADPTSLVTTWTNAGLAWKRAENYEQSEQCYIKALKLIKSRPNKAWNLNDDEVTQVLTNLLMLYYVWGRQSGQVRVANEDEQMESVFCGLLHGARFAASQGGLSHHMVFTFGKKTQKTLLKPEYKKHKACQRVIAKAVETATRSGFRSAILATLPPNSIIMTNAPENDMREDRRNSRRAAKDELKNNLGAGSTFKKCNNPECTTTADIKSEDLMSCPCKAVSYCQKACQTEHWRLHKEICSWYTQKKTAKATSK